MQNVEGGFGGGHGQISHCASSYAVVLSLAMVGGADGLGMIDRKALWHWLGQVKQADGGFRVCVDGEEDVRGGYCSMVMISLLNLPLSLPPEAPARRAGLESFIDGLPEYMSRCQTFEGGISGSPQTEAHGAYAFCALACLSILGPPQRMISSYLDVPLLVAWLSARQYTPEGGFAGRTNKLVDGCYSHWVGGCWPLLDAAISDTQAKQAAENLPGSSLYSRDGLTRYILACCQSEKGGLRDKPSTYPDSYHTCYVLAGLSSAQHYNYYNQGEKDNGLPEFGDAFRWASMPYRSSHETGDGSRLRPIHPIYVIPWSAVEDTREYFEQQGQF
ncbi:CAAX farnesyltransferase (FTase) subunit beta, variant 2 [Xanthoria calcicola]